MKLLQNLKKELLLVDRTGDRTGATLQGSGVALYKALYCIC